MSCDEIPSLQFDMFFSFVKFSVDHKSHNQNHTKNLSKDHIHFTFHQDDLLQLVFAERIIDLQHSRDLLQ